MVPDDCNGVYIRSLQNSINDDIKLLSFFEELSEFFMLDYYTGLGYNLLIKSWLSIAKAHTDEFLKEIISKLLSNNQSSNNMMMPLSLLSFIAVIRHRILKRAHIQGQCEKRLKCFKKEQLRHLKPKKIVEIESLIPCVQNMIESNGISHIVDIGAGLGHASRFIASHFPSCTVLRVEAQSTLIEKAQNIDMRFSNKSENLNIFSTVCRLVLDDSILDSFQAILADVDSDNNTIFSHSRILLLGLHPCGNLGSYMMRLFKDSTACKGIIIISCCYMHIDADDANKGGFPLSKHVQSRGLFELDAQVKEQACHNIEYYLTTLLNSLKTPDNLSQHWRSIADIFIAKRDPAYSRTCFKFKKRKNLEDIVTFINKNLANHRMDLLQHNEVKMAEELSDINQWKSWVYYFVYILKISLGVVGESLILADRTLFLLENSFSSSLEVVFDPIESPRNMAIISRK